MVCNNGKKNALREMQVLLEFIEAEISELTLEKKVLTSEFHSISSDERAIIRNLFKVQSELDINLNSIKASVEFIDEYQRKNMNDGPTHFLHEIQSKKLDLIARQEKIQRLLSEQRCLEAKNQEILAVTAEKASQIRYWQGILEKYKALESHKEFISKAQMLEDKCEELTELIQLVDSCELVVSRMSGIEPVQAKLGLEKIQNENQALVTEINNATNQGLHLRKEADSKNKKLVELWIQYYELEMHLNSLDHPKGKNLINKS